VVSCLLLKTDPSSPEPRLFGSHGLQASEGADLFAVYHTYLHPTTYSVSISISSLIPLLGVWLDSGAILARRMFSKAKALNNKSTSLGCNISLQFIRPVSGHTAATRLARTQMAVDFATIAYCLPAAKHFDFETRYSNRSILPTCCLRLSIRYY
jgi:hypothetical protein